MKKLNWLLILSLYMAMGCKKSGSGDDSPNPPAPPPPPPPVVVAKKTFRVDGTQLMDSAGHEFIMRGNNFPVFWFPNDYKPALEAASSLGCNAARLVWQVQVEAWTPKLSVLDEALAACLAQKMVAVVELHDFTGGTAAANIADAAAYYCRPEVKSILDKYTHALIINIANEWGDGSLSGTAWKAAYQPAIAALRTAGYKVPIMIDAPGYGQNESAIVDFGLELRNSDPLKNIIFSAHAYSNWNAAGTYNGRINAILSKDLCFVFGEFGWNVPDNQQPTDFNCKVDASLLMQLCQSKKVGYFGWSWKGNNAANACFDMCSSWSDTTQLTSWGRQWAYDVNGVKNTGVKASIF